MTETSHNKPIDGLFVTGTNTDIGKTLSCAALMALLDAQYWKPVQSGPVEDHDAPTVIKLSGCKMSDILPPLYSFPDPLSPHEAARLAGEHIDFSSIERPVEASKFTIVEGAGGVLVPLNEDYLVIDLIKKLGLPALIIASSTLGTINHTLLTLEALRARDISIFGVVLSGPENPANKKAIETYGKVQVMAEIPQLNDVTQDTIKTILPTLKNIAEALNVKLRGAQ